MQVSKTEKNYSTHKLEFLYGGEFEVYTDNNPLTYVLTTAKLDATGQRWIASFTNYNFSICYGSGKSNIDADALSRIP